MLLIFRRRRCRRARGDKPEHYGLLASRQPCPSVLSECFDHTLLSVLSECQASQSRVILITSPSSGEGKTTVAGNLAVALAEINRRVLLIDGDMRKPQLHRIFDLPNNWGLSIVLRSRFAISQLPSDFIGLTGRTTEQPGLFVLPSGPTVSRASKLLHSPRAVELIDYARTKFDIVLIDSPAVMQISDARVLGKMADSAILVVRAGKTRRDTARAAVERLSEDGVRVVGTVLNRWDPTSDGYGYYDYDLADTSYYAAEQRDASNTSSPTVNTSTIS